MVGPVLIVGAGLFGAVCARELTDAGIRCRVVERRAHIGGNCHTRPHPGIGCHEHVYGPHVFHTDAPALWRYVNRFGAFNGFVNRPRVRFGDRVFSFPINLLTLHQLFGVSTPAEAEEALRLRRRPGTDESSVEGWCLAHIGEELYETFVLGYTWKQWNRHPRELPSDIIRRLPVRLTFDDNYYTDRFQGVPAEGYGRLFERLLEGVAVELETDFLPDREYWMARHPLVIYTGALDAFFAHECGPLEYRSLRFEREELPVGDFQGNAVVNYTEREVPWTRIVEHKHFGPDRSRPRTLITREFPADRAPGCEPCYPVRTPDNLARLGRYRARGAELEGRVLFGGRLAEYRYYDMDDTVAAALGAVRRLLGPDLGGKACTRT
ncbi:MAG: UDP-galactopyranose mutase [Acidobacteria bacterium]|nr:UDP-galactopyranose mutase [Acidobacteriota bacterium]